MGNKRVRNLNVKAITKAVEELVIKANLELRPDVLNALKKALRREKNRIAKETLKAILENAKVARREKIALCQDTGMVSVYIDICRGAKITGGDLEEAVNRGVRDGYMKGRFRRSIVKDPLLRKGKAGYIPCVLYVRFTKWNKVVLTVGVKGFGSENKSRVKMFRPTASTEEVRKFIIETVKEAGPDACPPFVLGIGIGGTLDKACSLAKEALLRPINKRNPLTHIARLEKDVMAEANRLGIGPMGLGGRTTVLGVNVLSYPTHIAGMPVAVNISCHATRSATKII